MTREIVRYTTAEANENTLCRSGGIENGTYTLKANVTAEGLNFLTGESGVGGFVIEAD